MLIFPHGNWMAHKGTNLKNSEGYLLVEKLFWRDIKIKVVFEYFMFGLFSLNKRNWYDINQSLFTRRHIFNLFMRNTELISKIKEARRQKRWRNIYLNGFFNFMVCFLFTIFWILNPKGSQTIKEQSTW